MLLRLGVQWRITMVASLYKQLDRVSTFSSVRRHWWSSVTQMTSGVPTTPEVLFQKRWMRRKSSLIGRTASMAVRPPEVINKAATKPSPAALQKQSPGGCTNIRPRKGAYRFADIRSGAGGGGGRNGAYAIFAAGAPRRSGRSRWRSAAARRWRTRRWAGGRRRRSSAACDRGRRCSWSGWGRAPTPCRSRSPRSPTACSTGRSDVRSSISRRSRTRSPPCPACMYARHQLYLPPIHL